MERRRVQFNIQTASCGFCNVDTESTVAADYVQPAREAVSYCKTCAQFLCSNCLKPHRKLVVAENHKLLNRDHFNLADDDNGSTHNLRNGRQSSFADIERHAENVLHEYEQYRSKVMKEISQEIETVTVHDEIDKHNDTVLDVESDKDVDHNNGFNFTEYCAQHPDDMIKYYCENHDKLCCEVCKHKEHVVCSSKVKFIPEILSKDNQSLLPPFKMLNAQIADFKDYDKKLQHDLKELKKSRGNFLHDLKNKKREILQWFNIMEVRAVRKVETIFDRCKQDIEKKRQKAKNACREMRAEIYFLKEIMINNMHDDIYKFIRMKRANCFVIETAKKKEHRQFTNTRFSLKIHEDFETIKRSADQLYELDFEKKGETKYNVRLKDDQRVCNITGCVMLSTGGVVVADRNNANVKAFTSQFKLSALVKIPDGVYDIGHVTEKHFAVTCPLKSKIHIVVLLPVPGVSKCIDTGEGSCWGVKYHSGIFIVNCTTKSSNFIRAVDEESRVLFQVKTKCNFSSELFIDDVTKRLVIITATSYLDGNGTEIIHYVDEHRTGEGDNVDLLEYNYLNHLNTKGLTVDTHNNVVVCCKDTHQIYTIAQTGSDAELLLAEPDGLHRPHALCYNLDKSKLLVTSENTDFVQIFEFVP